MDSNGNVGINNTSPTKQLIPYIYNELDHKFDCSTPLVYSNQTIEGCNIQLMNIDVENNAELEIDHQGSVTLDKGFELKAGSTLEIKYW